MSSREYICRIDAQDLITEVNQHWLEFARENDASELADPEAITGHSIWSFFADSTTIHLYQAMVGQVRARPDEIIQFDLHCDGPTVRRLFQMTIRSLPLQAVEFASCPLLEEPRPYVSLLDQAVDRSDQFTKMCSWCQRLELPDSRWADIDAAIPVLRLFHPGLPPQITHGMCPDCLERFMAK